MTRGYLPLPKWLQDTFPSGCQRRKPFPGFTLIELLLAIATVGTIVAIAIPMYAEYLARGKIARAMIDIQMLQMEIMTYRDAMEKLPDTLADMSRDNLLDPWGTPYQYGNYDIIPQGKWRKDHFLVPVNSDYDLYSKGKDGNSLPPFGAPVSWDDIVRANDGAYFGLASDY